MTITEVRVKLADSHAGERLRAFCSVTFDGGLVVKDTKVVDGERGLFVAMPSRRLADRCTGCGSKNHLRSRFCNHCGVRHDEERASRDAEGPGRLYTDVVHPINAACRELIHRAVMVSYANELAKAKLPGYVSRYDDYYDFHEFDTVVDPVEAFLPASRSA